MQLTDVGHWDMRMAHREAQQTQSATIEHKHKSGIVHQRKYGGGEKDFHAHTKLITLGDKSQTIIALTSIHPSTCIR